MLCLKKQRHYFTNKGPSSQSYGFSSSHVCMWELDYKESWALKNWYFCGVGEHSSVSWTARGSIQSILKEINPEYSLEGLMLKLKLQYFGHLMRRTDSLERLCCWERLKAGTEGNNRGWDGWMASLKQWTWVWVSSGSCWWAGKGSLACCNPWGHKELDTPEGWNWTEVWKAFVIQMEIFNNLLNKWAMVEISLGSR